MIRKFLFELIDEVLAGEDREKAFKEMIQNNKYFADFVDITYNLNYNWEFDDNYHKKARSNRDKGGIAGQWVEIVKLVKRSVCRNTNESPHFMNRLDRMLDLCNQKDIRIILCALKKRSIQYITTKKVYEWFPEYLKRD